MDEARAEQRSLRAAAAADFRAATVRRRVALAGVVAWMAYEWGPGNETLTPWVVARVIDGQRGPAVIGVTAAAGFVLTLVQQMVSGTTALAGFSAFPRFAEAAGARVRDQFGTAPAPWGRLDFGARCALAFGLGTTAVALVQIVATKTTGVRVHIGAVARSAVLCALIVAALAATAAGIAQVGRHSARLGGPTDDALQVLANPLVWLGVFALMAGARLVRRVSAGSVKSSLG